MFGGVINAKWNKDKHPRHSKGTPKGGQFADKYSYEGQKDTLAVLGITESEFMSIVSLIDTEYHKRHTNKDVIEHHTSLFIYYAENHGYHNYLFYGIKFNDDTGNEWFI